MIVADVHTEGRGVQLGPADGDSLVVEDDIANATDDLWEGINEAAYQMTLVSSLPGRR